VEASEELFVTPAAISHQVKRLEEYLGLKLFLRLPRGLMLSETGGLLFDELQGVFEHLDMAMSKVVESNSQKTLSISVAPAFATKWLLPRLKSFEVNHSDIDLRISSSLKTIDFKSSTFDATVRLGHGDYPGLESVKLFEESVTPMCSPSLLDATPQINQIDFLYKNILLHDDSMASNPITPNWKDWLDASKIANVDVTRGLRFSQPDHAIQAAIDGAGIVLGWRSLATADISSGRLVAPFELSLPLGLSFYLVYPKANANQKKIQKLLEWVLKEVGQN
jgi:LysR family glycine cleavage system transcriptional activator